MPGTRATPDVRALSTCHPWPLAFPNLIPSVHMAKRTKSKPQERGSVLFDVVYEDDSRASNRRVPMQILGGLDGDDPARELIAEQDRAIAEKSGRPLRAIKSLTRSPPRESSSTPGE